MPFDPLSAAFTIGGGLLGLLDSKEQRGAVQEANAASGMPRWDPRQEDYLFNAPAYQFPMPGINANALNYGRALSGGFNPATGPQGPVGAGAPGGMPGGGNPYFLDPSATPQDRGILGLLGYGAGTAPPLLSNSPFFGQGVYNPEQLQGAPGGAPGPGAQQTPGAPGAQQPQAQQAIPAWLGGPGVQTPVGGFTLAEAAPLARAGILAIDPGSVVKAQWSRGLNDANLAG